MAGEFLKDQLKTNSRSVLGLATGGTVKGVYSELVKLYSEGQLSFSHAASFNLDEYYGMEKNDVNSYFRYMKEHLFHHVDFLPGSNHLPDGMAADPIHECSRYEEMIEKAGGVDLQLLGIGENGHIGFNEPGTSFQERTHLVTLTDSTKKANARYFKSLEDVPGQAITMGIGTIMKSRSILLLASGAKKAEAIERLWNGEVTEDFPASVLKRHPNVTVIADEEALMLIDRKGKEELTR